MSIHYSESGSRKLTSSVPLTETGQSEPATFAASGNDWRPGSAPRKQRRRKTLNIFASVQKERLLELRTALTESMNLTASDTCPNPGDASALATHPGDAGTDASDRDLAFRLLCLEQNTLNEIDEALRRIDEGTYGICEISGAPIPIQRLEALPFARLTVECQAQKERRGFRAHDLLANIQ